MRGIILSGGPASVYEAGAPQLPDWVLESGLPVLGICYGMQLIAQALGGSVEPADRREYGPARLWVTSTESPLFAHLPDSLDVWMSHGDHVARCRRASPTIGQSDNAPCAAIAQGQVVAIQFHPEVAHTPLGQGDPAQLPDRDLRLSSEPGRPPRSSNTRSSRFARRSATAGCCCGLSGGVDSSVAAALIHRAIGDQLTPVFVNNGLLRLGEAELVQTSSPAHFGMQARLCRRDRAVPRRS